MEENDIDGDMNPSVCPNCNEPVFPEDEFCEACRWSLRGAVPAGTTPAPVREPAPGPAPTPAPLPKGDCVECGGGPISGDGYCEQCGLRQPSGREHVEVETPVAAGVSNRGLRHSRNEDFMVVTGVAGRVVGVVCDGVSSAPRPEDASQVAAETGAAMLTAQLDAGADPEAATRAALARAAKAVTALADSPYDAPACTYVSAVVGPDAVTIGWTGDSRAYWVSAGDGARPSAALTVDDSWAAQMVALGVMTSAEAHADRRAHTVTAWLGADAGEVETRAETFSPGGPGLVVICSDGLWNYLPEPAELAEAVHIETGKAGAPRTGAPGFSLGVARGLVRTALEAGGHDNVTVVLIPFPPQAGPSTEPKP